jgi:hypothetical protein
VLSYVAFLLGYDTAPLDFGFLLLKKNIFVPALSAEASKKNLMQMLFEKTLLTATKINGI